MTPWDLPNCPKNNCRLQDLQKRLLFVGEIPEGVDGERETHWSIKYTLKYDEHTDDKHTEILQNTLVYDTRYLPVPPLV